MNLETLHKYKEDGLLRCQTHPNLPLTIWNYTEKVQYEKLWDGVTLACRGLVTDDLGNVVARPFKKFFNIEEGKHTPTKEFEVYEKMDGSLGIVFYYGGEWHVATRGSFTSEQAVRAKEMLSKYDFSYLAAENIFTFLVEVIYPENRIVVDYGNEEKLVWLSTIEVESGEEVFYPGADWECAKKYNGIKDVDQLKETIGDNREGYIILFSNGDRCKIKGEEYLRLHKIMTEVSTTGIWESLKNGDDIAELLKDVPDEFFDKIEEYAEELVSEYMLIEAKCLLTFNQHVGLSKKEFAEQVKWNKYSGILFKMYDDKDYSESIWRKIKPEFKKL